jgi:hypothetical protein
MKTYGHLRDQHSTTMAQKVIFSEPTSKITSLPLSKTAVPKGQRVAEKKTIAQAKAKYSYPWWASDDAVEVFWGQVNEHVRIVPFEKYFNCAQQAMGRAVFKQELDDAQSLVDEFLARVPEATIKALLVKIPRGLEIPA